MSAVRLPARAVLATLLALLAMSMTSGPLPLSSGAAIAAPTVSIEDASVTEGSVGTSTLTFTVTLLDAVPDQTTTVQYATADIGAQAPADYTSASGTVTFDPGQTSQPVSITVAGDALDEPDETLGVGLSDPVGATIADGSAIGTITDDDPPPSLSVGDVSTVEGGAGSANRDVTVTLSAPSGWTVTVDHTTLAGTASAGTDFTAASGQLSFAPGETSKVVSVELLGDAIDEADEALSVELSNATNATIGDASAAITIDDDDGPQVSIADGSVTEGTGGTGTLTLTVTLSAPSPQGVTVQFATADGTATAPADYDAASGTVTFAPGETSKTVSITVQRDALDESDEAFTAVLSGAIDGTIGDGAATATVTDDDAAPTPPPPPVKPAPPSPAPAGRDRTAPRLSRLVLTPKLARRGSTLRLVFRLDEAARVAGRMMLRSPGVRTKGGRCVIRTRQRRGPACIRRTRAGTLLARAAFGDNRARVDLSGLRAGDYVLELTPTDAAGNTGAAKLIAFRIRG